MAILDVAIGDARHGAIFPDDVEEHVAGAGSNRARGNGNAVQAHGLWLSGGCSRTEQALPVPPVKNLQVMDAHAP